MTNKFQGNRDRYMQFMASCKNVALMSCAIKVGNALFFSRSGHLQKLYVVSQIGDNTIIG